MEKEHPKMNSVDLTKIIALRWRALPSAEKEPFKAQGAKDKARYDRELKRWTKYQQYA